jgi:hypothetical protein
MDNSKIETTTVSDLNSLPPYLDPEGRRIPGYNVAVHDAMCGQYTHHEFSSKSKAIEFAALTMETAERGRDSVAVYYCDGTSKKIVWTSSPMFRKA